MDVNAWVIGCPFVNLCLINGISSVAFYKWD